MNNGTTIRISDDTYDRLNRYMWARINSGGNTSDFETLTAMFGITPNDAIHRLLKEAGF